MFGKKKDRKKKTHSIKYVVLQNGLSNFPNDFVIEVIVDEPNGCINFIKGKNDTTATLQFNKIVRTELGTRIGTIPGALGSNKTQTLQTLKIVYISNDEEKEINLYQTNYGNTMAITLLKTLLDVNIQENLSAPKHIDL